MLSNRGLRSSRRNCFQAQDINPMENLANVVYVMLVLSFLLLIAIILHWNVDLSRIMDVVTQEDLVEVKDLQDAARDGSLMEDLDSKGFVYEDPETGKMYIITNE